LQLGLGTVGRTVIDIDDFERPLPFERRGDFRHQRRDVACLVTDRNDDGDGWVTAVHHRSLLS
jgi:hypothetical protein